jgi:hypothetical protein
LQQEHERTGTAVHDRHLGRRKIDIRVVDAKAGYRRKQVLDRGDADIALHQRCRQPRVTHVFATGTDFHRLGEIHAPEDNPCIDRSGAQGHVDLVTRMETYACRPDYILERALFDHVFGLTPGAGASKRRGD